MNATFASKLFSSSTALLSRRAIARSTPHHRVALATRLYSDQKSTEQSSSEHSPEQSSSSTDPAPESEAKEVPVQSEVLEKLKQKEAEVLDLTSRLRYLQADFLNLQRNAAREKEQQRDFAVTRFAGDLLETVDVLALALKSVPSSALLPEQSSSSDIPPSSDSPSTPPKSAHAYLTELHQGVDMTHRLLLATLFKYNVKSFDPTGEQFDPNRHEALYQAAIPGKEPGTVLECQKTGYTIKDRLLRAAQVGVVQENSS